MKDRTLTGLKKDPLNLNRLLLVWIKSFFLGLFIKPKDFKLPKKIGEYRYVKDFTKIGTAKEFKLAIYKGPKGERVIAKVWSGSFKNFSYYTLQNEITMYRLLNLAYERAKNAKSVESRNMYIPELLQWKEKKGVLVLLIEYINGQIASELPARDKVTLYLRSMKFINHLAHFLTKEEKDFISTRSSLQYLFLYPLLLVKAIITNPRATGLLLKGSVVFARSLPLLLKASNKELIHRDLHFRNIIFSKKRAVLIDLQYCIFTETMYEFVTTLRYRWKEDHFYELLLATLNKRYKTTRDFYSLFRGLVINSATHGLTAGHFSKRKIDNFIDFLRFAFSSNFPDLDILSDDRKTISIRSKK